MSGERPDPEFIRCDWCGRHGHCGNVICEVCAEKAAAPVPSPVPRRPDTARLRSAAGWMRDWAQGPDRYDHGWGEAIFATADWIDAQPAADQGPDLEELRAEIADLREANARQAKSIQGFISEFGPSPLDRLLDREGGT